jgi:hypothetical protein
VGVRVSCAIKPPEQCLQEDDVYRFARLRSLRNLVGPGMILYKRYHVEEDIGYHLDKGTEEGPVSAPQRR